MVRLGKEGQGPYTLEAPGKPEAVKLKEDNEQLRSKLETYTLEIQSLKTQLNALLPPGEESRGRSQREQLTRTRSSQAKSPTRGNKGEGAAVIRVSSTLLIEDEAEINSAIRNSVVDLNDHVDLMLMLHMQASSLEVLINSTY